MTYGEKITSDERFNRTGLDLLARMIYVEAEGESEMGKRAVACVARNRKDHKKASKFGGTTYKDVILMGAQEDPPRLQFSSVGTAKFLHPDLNSTAWKDSLNIALNMDTVVNPISACLWFCTNDVYSKNSKIENGIEKYSFGGNYEQVTEKKILGGHTFFRVINY